MTLVIDKAAPTVAGDAGRYYQCLLRQGDTRTVGWIEERGAKVGARVELKDHDGLWHVLAVYQPPRDVGWLREKQRKDRRGLRSVK